MLKIDELKRLEKLSCISLSNKEENKFLDQLWNIINFLEKLKELKIENVENNLNIENSLRTIDGVKDFEDKEKIMQNVQHPIINNCIEIKSVLV